MIAEWMADESLRSYALPFGLAIGIRDVMKGMSNGEDDMRVNHTHSRCLTYHFFAWHRNLDD